MSWVALAGVAALLGTLAVEGCGPQPSCQDDSACGPAAKCDTQTKTCVQRREDGSCTAACAEWEYCSEGVCYQRYEKVLVLEPAAGTVDGGAAVRAQLQTVAPWINEKAHAKLAYKVSNSTTDVSSGDLTPGGGSYGGHISVGSDGAYTLTAGFPGFPSDAPVSDPVQITVDVDPPVLAVNTPMKTGLRMGGAGQPDDRDPQLANAFKRNDSLNVLFGSDTTDLDTGSLALAVKGMTTGAPVTFQTTGTSGCGKTQCFQATVDLSKVEMLALRGSMDIVVTGRDRAGNLGAATTQIPVTRFKWSRGTSGGSITSSPAIGFRGTVFVGTNGGTSGTLSAIKPDGTDQWGAPVSFGSAFLASPAVGKGDGQEEIVYAIPNGNPPLLYARFGADGTDAGTITAGSSGSAQASPLIASTTRSLDATRESATTFLNGSVVSLVSLRYGYPISDNGLLGDAGTVLYPGNIVGADNLAFAGDDVGRVREYSYVASGSWSESTSTVRVTSGAPIGLLLSSTSVAGATSGNVFSFPRSSGTSFVHSETNPSIPVMAGGDLVYSEGANFKVIRVNPSGSGTPSAQAVIGGVTTSGLVAKDQTIYFIRKNTNAIYAFSSSLTPLWSDTVEASVVVASSPNIDCNRSSTGTAIAGPGTLYYGADNGKLYAIIVDNPGIDTTSDWPKYQHDPRNTGSLSTPLSEFACP